MFLSIKFTCFISLIIVECFGKNMDVLIDYYEREINNIVENAKKFTPDKNAGRYRPKSDEVQDYGSFDYIVIGAGTAGCVIANRLSEIEDVHILLLEAGKKSSVINEMPALYGLASSSDYNWGFYSTPQKYGCQGFTNHSCACPRGRGVGGTSLINFIMYSRANENDFKKIARKTKSVDWEYINVLEYFKKSENFTKTNSKAIYYPYFHGENGYWSVENSESGNLRNELFLKANLELGNKITDYNSRAEVGVSYTQTNKKQGRRADTGSAFIEPIIKRKNFKVSQESYVIKIEFDPATKAATSVLFTKKGILYRATSRREIILSAGAYHSPQILQLSGIGKSEELKKLNIPIISDLSVGNNLRDHLVMPITISHNMTDPKLDLRTALRQYIDHKGVLAGNDAEILGFYDTNKGKYPDYELVMTPQSPNPIEGVSSLKYSTDVLEDMSNIPDQIFAIASTLQNTKSVGSVKLQSNSPYNYPEIDLNILSNEQDFERLYRMMKQIQILTQTEAFKKINATIVPLKLRDCVKYEYDSKEYWYCIFRKIAFCGYHPVGTCAMGRNPKKGAVVDPKLRVFGVQNLRVADASIYPYPLRAHNAANCVLVGEIASDFIKEDLKLA
ncbi:unnamed protein product [Brassicogethes aeneus]|uniref:Glucose-methanol-choline oxidoreductase N-terminal domain-containing protein n=1 Tax=Brassicogethes aeneus TaxID=1431903 RepID=A0A9P0FQP8_BRAAE|nr:unnamed protein product [Brassicogethes aeneus]